MHHNLLLSVHRQPSKTAVNKGFLKFQYVKERLWVPQFPRVDNSNKGIQLIFLLAHYLLFQPLLAPTLKQNDTIMLQLHYSLCPMQQLLQLHFCYLSLEHGILDPVQVLPT